MFAHLAEGALELFRHAKIVFDQAIIFLLSQSVGQSRERSFRGDGSCNIKWRD